MKPIDIENFDFSHLSLNERVMLAERLWDSIEEHVKQKPLTDEQMDEVENRIKSYKAGEMETSTWDEVKSRWDSL
ncbi:MAG: addiction module protein [Pseudomonadota bacterium]